MSHLSDVPLPGGKYKKSWQQNTKMETRVFLNRFSYKYLLQE